MERVGIRSRRTVLALDYIVRTQERAPAPNPPGGRCTRTPRPARAPRASPWSGPASTPSQIGLVDRGRLLAAVLDPGRGLPGGGRARHLGAGLRHHLGLFELRRAAASPARDAARGAARLRARRERGEHDADRGLPRSAHRPCCGATAARPPWSRRASRRRCACGRASCTRTRPGGTRSSSRRAATSSRKGPAVQGFAIRKSVATLHELAAHAARRSRRRMCSSGTRRT